LRTISQFITNVINRDTDNLSKPPSAATVVEQLATVFPGYADKAMYNGTNVYHGVE
jgi:hypothetical protein